MHIHIFFICSTIENKEEQTVVHKMLHNIVQASKKKKMLIKKYEPIFIWQPTRRAPRRRPHNKITDRFWEGEFIRKSTKRPKTHPTQQP